MDPIDAFVTNRTSAKTLANGLRNGIRAMAERYGFDYHDRLEWLVADKIDELIAENAKLKAERDAAAEVIKSILQNENIDLCLLCEYGNSSDAKCTEPNGREWCLKNAKWVGTE